MPPKVGDIHVDPDGRMWRVTSVTNGTVISDEIKRGIVKMNYDVVKCIEISMKNASNMLDHFVVKCRPEELFTALCGDRQEMLAHFSTVGRYLKPSNYHDMVTVPVLMEGATRTIDITFTVSLESCDRFPCYFMPHYVGPVTPESKFFRTIAPAIVLAQEWQMTDALFKRLNPVLSSDQLAFTLPWLKDVARDILADWSEGGMEEWKLRGKYNLGMMTAGRMKTFKTALSRLARPMRASNTPALTPRINAATRLGERLFSQARMLKGKEAETPGGTFIAVAPSEQLLPQWFTDDLQGVMAHWQEEQEQRTMERIAVQNKMRPRP